MVFSEDSQGGGGGGRTGTKNSADWKENSGFPLICIDCIGLTACAADPGKCRKCTNIKYKLEKIK